MINTHPDEPHDSLREEQSNRARDDAAQSMAELVYDSNGLVLRLHILAEEKRDDKWIASVCRQAADMIEHSRRHAVKAGDLAQVLASCGVVQESAVYSPEAHDNYATLNAINAAARKLNGEPLDSVAEPITEAIRDGMTPAPTTELRAKLWPDLPPVTLKEERGLWDGTAHVVSLPTGQAPSQGPTRTVEHHA